MCFVKLRIFPSFLQSYLKQNKVWYVCKSVTITDKNVHQPNLSSVYVTLLALSRNFRIQSDTYHFSLQNMPPSILFKIGKILHYSVEGLTQCKQLLGVVKGSL